MMNVSGISSFQHSQKILSSRLTGVGLKLKRLQYYQIIVCRQCGGTTSTGKHLINWWSVGFRNQKLLALFDFPTGNLFTTRKDFPKRFFSHGGLEVYPVW